MMTPAPRWRPVVLASTAALLASGCPGIQSAIDPAGPQAALLSNLWWFFLVVCSVVFVLVAGALFYAILHRRQQATADPLPESDDRGSVRAVMAGTIATGIILIVFLVASVGVGRAIQPDPDSDPVMVDVIGSQWWWAFRVHGATESETFETANELHIPAGRWIRLELESRDVIHSFWVPNLQGKMDLIPGTKNVLWLQAERPGVYRGQCAEFCGIQHAHMGLIVVVQPEDEWNRWVEHQRRPARAPRTDSERRGQQVFLTAPCVICHTIRGTPAGGNVAPDLTHLASRRTIGAAILPNSRGQLGGWVLDSQHVKPGNRMPPIHLESGDLHDLLAYLESLK